MLRNEDTILVAKTFIGIGKAINKDDDTVEIALVVIMVNATLVKYQNILCQNRQRCKNPHAKNNH
jgi:hypothetical protein